MFEVDRIERQAGVLAIGTIQYRRADIRP